MINGIIRKIEKNGIIVIPKTFRQALNIKEGDDLVFTIDKSTNSITITPAISPIKNTNISK